jgi:hypothetical protein
MPCGIVDEHSGALFIEFGSSCKTSDFIVDPLDTWWNHLSADEQRTIPLIQTQVSYHSPEL